MLKRLMRIRFSLQRADPQELTSGDARQFRQFSPGNVANGPDQPYWAPFRDEQKLSTAGPVFTNSAAKVGNG